MDGKRCGALTSAGTPCKQKVGGESDNCWMHRGPQCSVCLACMGGPSPVRKLGCGHEFHIKCVDRWKLSCSGPDPTCPICREPFDVPTYRCRLIIERAASPDDRRVIDFETQNVASITDGFGIDFRQLVPSQGRFYTDIHFDIDPTEVLEDVLRTLGLPIS
jgi:hypothetical protein